MSLLEKCLEVKDKLESGVNIGDGPELMRHNELMVAFYQAKLGRNQLELEKVLEGMKNEERNRYH